MGAPAEYGQRSLSLRLYVAVVPLLAPLLFAVIAAEFRASDGAEYECFQRVGASSGRMDTRFHRKQRDGTAYSRERAE